VHYCFLFVLFASTQKRPRASSTRTRVVLKMGSDGDDAGLVSKVKNNLKWSTSRGKASIILLILLVLCILFGALSLLSSSPLAIQVVYAIVSIAFGLYGIVVVLLRIKYALMALTALALGYLVLGIIVGIVVIEAGAEVGLSIFFMVSPLAPADPPAPVIGSRLSSG
jgi:hypothetical protein